MSTMDSDVLLEISELSVTFKNRGETTVAVDGVSFDLKRKQRLGIVGESGSGKSVTSLSILNLLNTNPNNHSQGSILYHGGQKTQDLLAVEESALYKIRGRKISIVSQEPMSTLNPVRKCGDQVKEVLEVHDLGDKSGRKAKIIDLFKQVSLPDVERIYDSYPHQLSGGQLQRVNIAMALASDPDIIICDEPTTALDVTVQSQIIDLLKEMVQSQDIALIFISHDLDVVADICDSVVVMYQGKVVESGDLPDTFAAPSHPYTKALLSCKPTKDNRGKLLPTVDKIMKDTYVAEMRKKVSTDLEDVVISVDQLNVHFPNKRASLFGPKTYVKAVDDLSFDIRRSEILGIVGESGSGKSTVANCLAGLIEPTSGQMFYKGNMLNKRVLTQDRKLRTSIQLVFQDPYSSLNPKMTIGAAIKEPLRYHGIVSKDQLDNELRKLLNQVGLDDSYADRYPHQLSGGQRQRVCIARALSVRPDLLICDESVSALDVSVQAQILNLLDQLRGELHLTILFISHDLSVVHYLCDQVIVMKDGKIVERGSATKIMMQPEHDYTKKLIDSLPQPISETF